MNTRSPIDAVRLKVIQHPPSLDQAALRLLPEAAAVLVHIEAYASSHYSSRELQARLATRFD